MPVICGMLLVIGTWGTRVTFSSTKTRKWDRADRVLVIMSLLMTLGGLAPIVALFSDPVTILRGWIAGMMISSSLICCTHASGTRTNKMAWNAIGIALFLAAGIVCGL